jgi:hypothetical protein
LLAKFLAAVWVSSPPTSLVSAPAASVPPLLLTATFMPAFMAGPPVMTIE